MKRRNLTLALTALLVAAVTLAQKGLRGVGSRVFHSLMAWYETRAKLNERQKRIDAAEKDLRVIFRAELSHIEKTGKFATLDELSQMVTSARRWSGVTATFTAFAWKETLSIPVLILVRVSNFLRFTTRPSVPPSRRC